MTGPFHETSLVLALLTLSWFMSILNETYKSLDKCLLAVNTATGVWNYIYYCAMSSDRWKMGMVIHKFHWPAFFPLKLILKIAQHNSQFQTPNTVRSLKSKKIEISLIYSTSFCLAKKNLQIIIHFDKSRFLKYQKCLEYQMFVITRHRVATFSQNRWRLFHS